MKQIATFIVGAVLGASVMIAAKGHDLDHFYAVVSDLNQQIETQKEKIEDLKNELQTQRRNKIQRVRTINIIIDNSNPAEELVRLEIIKAAKEQLKPLIHMNLEALSTSIRPLVINMLNNKRVSVGNSTYIIEVTTVVVKEEFEVHISYKKESPVKLNP